MCVHFIIFQDSFWFFCQTWHIYIYICQSIYLYIYIYIYTVWTYICISMWIIINQYRSKCLLSTSITCLSLGLNASIHLSMIFAEFYSTLQQWLLLKNQDPLSFSLGIHFLPGVPNIWRVGLDVWALAPSCMNMYSLCFASLFISEIIFFNSALQ